MTSQRQGYPRSVRRDGSGVPGLARFQREICEQGGEASAWLGVLFRCFQNQGDGIAKPFPITGLLLHLSAALLGKRIELGFATRLRFFPFSLQPAAIFQTMECRIEGTLMDPE